MLDTRPSSTTIMSKSYSHCPLKKRPVQLVEEDIPDEPENLSTKPEDLSKSGRSPSPAHYYDYSPSPPPTSAFYPAISHPEYAPQTWHRSVSSHSYAYGFLPYVYQQQHHDYVTTPRSPYSDSSSLSPPHPLLPLAIRPPMYSDQSSLSPSSSSTASPPPPPPAASVGASKDLSEKTRHHLVDHHHHHHHHHHHRNSQQPQPQGGERHQCPDCGKSYSTFSGLSKHKQFHCAAGDGPKKSFSCKYCEKVYVSLGALKMHIRTHTLPCKCDICGKAFSRPWLLQGHIRTHTGEKPFSCTHCNRAFADRSNLRAHLQTHSDVKKYSCRNCNKTFSRMSLLTKHTEGGCMGNGNLVHLG